MDPESAKTHPDHEALAPSPGPARPAARARREADYGRRGKGYVYGAFVPATGEAFTHP